MKPSEVVDRKNYVFYDIVGSLIYCKVLLLSDSKDRHKTAHTMDLQHVTQ